MAQNLSPNDIIEIERRIVKLIFDVSDRPKYRTEVNKIMSDLFGIDRVANAFIDNSRSAANLKIRFYDIANPQRLFDMLVAENRDGSCDFSVFQVMVKLLSSISNSNRVTRDDKSSYYEKYEDLLNILRNEYDIKTISSIDSVTNPLKAAKKIIRNRGDDYDYDFYGGSNYGYSSRFKSVGYSDDDDDYEYNDSYFNRIIKGTSFEREPNRKKGSGKKRKYSSSYGDDDDDRDHDYDIPEENLDIMGEVTDQIKTIATAVADLQKKVNNPPPIHVPIPETSSPYVPHPKDDETIKLMADKLNQAARAINTLNKNSKLMQGALDELTSHVADIEEDIYATDDATSTDDSVVSTIPVDIDAIIANGGNASDSGDNP